MMVEIIHSLIRVRRQENYQYCISDMVASFGELNADTLDLITIANGREMASEMVDLVGFDE